MIYTGNSILEQKCRKLFSSENNNMPCIQNILKFIARLPSRYVLSLNQQGLNASNQNSKQGFKEIGGNPLEYFSCVCNLIY